MKEIVNGRNGERHYLTGKRENKIMEEFIKNIKALEPTKEQIGLENVPYAFGWVDAINAVESLVKESDSLPCVRMSLPSIKDVKEEFQEESQKNMKRPIVIKDKKWKWLDESHPVNDYVRELHKYIDYLEAKAENLK